MKLKLDKKTIKNLNIRSGIATGAPSTVGTIVLTHNCPSNSVVGSTIGSKPPPSTTDPISISYSKSTGPITTGSVPISF